jgi:FixJ family two-component response regulator
MFSPLRTILPHAVRIVNGRHSLQDEELRPAQSGSDALALHPIDFPEAGRPPRIVMLDDDECLLELFVLMVQSRIKDATVLPFVDARDALREVARDAPDVFTTGWIMPGLSGSQVLAHLARTAARFPVIVIAGYEGLTEENVRRAAGSNLDVSFLAKPFRALALLGMLEAALRTPQRQQVQWVTETAGA